MPSRRPSKKAPPPLPRMTIDVEAQWLMPELPPLPKLPPPPKYGLERRDTMEVKVEWLEGDSPKSKRPAGKKPPPLPREDPVDPPRSSRRPSKNPPARASKKPPPVPVPFMKKRAAPIPREDPEDAPRASKRPKRS